MYNLAEIFSKKQHALIAIFRGIKIYVCINRILFFEVRYVVSLSSLYQADRKMMSLMGRIILFIIQSLENVKKWMNINNEI